MIGQNALYNKRQIRHLIDQKLMRLVRNDMTYILGARCCDGVVLVGDTKITIEEGARYTYGKKLFKASETVVMGASGISGFFSSFQNRIAVKSGELIHQGVNINDPATVKVLAENVIREMHDLYEQDRYLLTNNFSVFLANRIFWRAELTNFTGYGLPEPVNLIKVMGHGEPYGALFIDKIWDKKMTMEQTARLAIFVIKLIQDTHIDASVGYSSELLPQIYYVPDVKFPDGFTISDPKTEEEQKVIDESFFSHPIRELTDEEVTCCINDVSSKVSELMNLFKAGQFKI
jgi:20S proteasome alpha/beta subunit